MINKSLRLSLTAVALAAGLIASASAQKFESGSYSGMQWEARSLLTGATTDGTGGGAFPPAGNALYHPSFPAYSGVVHLLMDYGPTIGAFICSGTLLNDRQSILTAAHCVSDGFGTPNPLTTTVYFQPDGGLDPATRIQTSFVPAAGVETRQVTNYFVHSSYTGQVIDQNDIAVLRLDQQAPSWSASYGIYTMDPEGADFNVAGYGRLGTGDGGANNFAARLRQGDNMYDFRMGNPVFGTNWATLFGAPFSRLEYSYLSDFDNGLAANDTACLVAQASNIGGAAGAVFCDLGRGLSEVGVAGGDSGGPNFINGLISGVNSYGLTFGLDWGDIGPVPCDLDPNTPTPTCLNSSFGEFSGFVPTFIHADFINAALVPEPETYALMALGLAAVGAAARRRRKAA